MYNFSQFIKHKKIKLAVVSISIFLPLLIILIFEKLNFQNIGLNDLGWLRYVVFALIEAWLISKIFNYIKIIVDPDFGKNQYIKLTDEREVFVKMRATALSLKLIVFFVLVTTLISSFLNQVVFYTLSSLLIVLFITYFFSMFYYKKKY